MINDAIPMYIRNRICCPKQKTVHITTTLRIHFITVYLTLKKFFKAFLFALRKHIFNTENFSSYIFYKYEWHKSNI